MEFEVAAEKSLFLECTGHIRRSQPTSMRVLDLRCGEICKTERQDILVLAVLHLCLDPLCPPLTCILNSNANK